MTRTSTPPRSVSPRPATTASRGVHRKSAILARAETRIKDAERAITTAPRDAFTAEEAPRRAIRAGATVSPAASRAIGLLAPPLAGMLGFVDPAAAGAVPAVCAIALGLPLIVARLAGKRALLPDPMGPLGTVLSVVIALIAASSGASAGALGAAGAAAGPEGAVVALAFALGVVEGGVVPGKRLAFALPLAALGLSLALIAAGAPATFVVAHALLLLGFGALGRGLFFGTLKAVQAREEARVDGELLRLYDDARFFGLVGSAEPGDKDAAEKRLVAQTLAVRDGCYRLLRLGARALRPDAAALYLIDASGTQLVLKEQLLDVEGPLAARIALGGTVTTTRSGAGGALTLALKKKQAVRLVDAESSSAVQAHRRGARAVLCAPLRDPFGARGEMRGVLVFDRSAADAFSEDDESFALALVEEIGALLRTERVLERLDGEHKKVASIFGAARAFGGVVRLDDAMDHALAAALDVAAQAGAPHATAALVVIERAPGATDDTSAVLRVRRVGGRAPELLACDDALSLADDTWLARAILQRTALPHVSLDKPLDTSDARGLYAAADARIRTLGDVRIAPLFSQGEPVAALVVAVPPGEKLRAAVVDGLLVAADLAGVALGGARLFETVEKQATTDGLTGLANRRTLDTRLDEAIARSRRLGTPLTVVLTDIDHFKSVNDTYGHGTGDEVLKGIARAIAATARTSDVVARYGGEEFCLVLEGTDPAGAVRLAERARLAIKGLRFETDMGPLSVTSSFGVALLTDDDDARSVRERADAGLYKAKQQGRDRVIL